MRRTLSTLTRPRRRHHKNRGPEYDCAWVAEKPDTRCAVKGVTPVLDGESPTAEYSCPEACGGCDDDASDAMKCVESGGYPVYIGPTPNDMLCKFPCGDDWTDCPIGRDPSTSPPCPADNPEASFAVPSEA